MGRRQGGSDLVRFRDRVLFLGGEVEIHFMGLNFLRTYVMGAFCLIGKNVVGLLKLYVIYERKFITN